MSKSGLILGGYILLLAGLGCSLWLYGNSREREGYLSAVKAQQSTDLAHLTAWASQQQEINQQVISGLDQLNAVTENPPAGPNVSAAIEWVRNTRKPEGGKN